MSTELFSTGVLTLSRKETYGKNKQAKSVPTFTSRMEKREYYKTANHFDIRNVLDIKGFLNDIRANWNTYISQVHQWIQKNPVKRLIVTGIFTIVFGIFASTGHAAFIQEYTYQVKSGDNIERIAAEHGVTPQEILDANGISSIEGQKILLPKVEDRMVTATILNVRAQPSTESGIIGKYKKGDMVKVAFVENGWAAILIKGRVCFVSANYLAEKQGFSSTVKEPIKTSSTEYVIKSGDTFTKIAKNLGISVSSIQKLNPTVDPAKLKIGQKIKIPAVSASTPNQIIVQAQIAGVDPNGTFRFITSDGKTHAAKASGNMINELFDLQGKKVTLILEGKRGQQMTLVSIQ